MSAIPREPDREDARERLLSSALSLFANQGFARTSTRELAEAAKVNVAAISYYFGDKAGLYRAAFFASMAGCDPDPEQLARNDLPLAEALRLFYAAFLEPLRMGETARLAMKLRFREMLEPTGLWEEEIMMDIKPTHEALLQVLSRRLGSPVDPELQRLAICLTGLGVHLHVGHDIIDHLAPELNAGPRAIDQWIDCLVRQGVAMVDAEARRRGAAEPAA